MLPLPYLLVATIGGASAVASNCAVDEISLLSLKRLAPQQKLQNSTQGAGPILEKHSICGSKGCTGHSVQSLFPGAFEKVLPFLIQPPVLPVTLSASNQSSGQELPFFSSAPAFVELESRRGSRTLLNSEQCEMSILGLTYHPFDVALYLDGSSPLWRRQNSVQDVVNNLEGAEFVIRTVQELPRVIPMRIITGTISLLMGDYVQNFPGCTKADLNQLLEYFAEAGHSYVNDEMGFVIDKEGVQVHSKQFVKRMQSSAMARMLVYLLLDPAGPLIGSSEKILERLKTSP
eukprot:gnl/TRDRNA2_/TRDRNA2_42301_c0_seq1.p1 gnl/TRDRNA2_/TRDRNA2_42301_c0~~gnl/TRDRNA2_/TRDRNA2_42301_c0_seq1.p1  ORF type:complete len:289 (+),score=26.90 gnl/TRDRNA2_/TRDRNA2_42301_c0_seq1:59-925(+)